MQLLTHRQQPINLTAELGKGGEARIFHVAQQPHQVAKIYYQPTASQEAKLRAMLANPPAQTTGHPAIAWPTELLYHQDQFVGFLMPKVTGSEPIFNLYNPARRRQQQTTFTWRALHRVALNLTTVVKAIHATGHIVGDLNESNILVNAQALVTLVDTDSFQIADEQGRRHRCAVGKPEYTSPELQGVSFRTIDQQAPHDYFSLGVLIFQLLMEGYHPFAGVLTSPMSVGRADLYCIKQGLFPYANKPLPDQPGHQSPLVSPPPSAPPFEVLHPAIQAAFIRCFVNGHQSPTTRPTTSEWQNVLNQAEQNLIVCPQKPHHIHGNHSPACPWCALEANTLRLTRPRRAYNRHRVLYQPARPAHQAFAPMPVMRTPWAERIQWGVLLLLLPLIGLGVGWFFWGNTATQPPHQVELRPTESVIEAVTDNPPVSQPTAETVALRETLTTQPTGENHQKPAVSQTRLLPYQQLDMTAMGADFATQDLVFAADRHLLVGLFSAGIWLYDLEQQQKVASLSPPAELTCLAVAPDSSLIAAGSQEGEIWLWRLSDGQLLHTLSGHTDSLTSLVFAQDGETLVSSSRDRTLKLWQPTTGDLRRTLTGHTHWVTGVTLTPDGQTVISGGWDKTLRVWHISPDGLLNIRTLYGNTDWVMSVALAPDGQMLASATLDSHIRLWRLSDGQLLHTLTGHTTNVNRVAFNPPGDRLISGSDDHTIRLWRVLDGQLLATGSAHTDSVLSVAFSADGRLVASSSLDRTVRLWQVVP